MTPSLVELAKANDISKRRKQQHSPWAIGGAALSGAGALGAAAYGLRRGRRGRLERLQNERTHDLFRALHNPASENVARRAAVPKSASASLAEKLMESALRGIRNSQ
jgi:hypothetical protein